MRTRTMQFLTGRGFPRPYVRRHGEVLSVVAAAKSVSYDRASMRGALRNCLDHLDPPFSKIVKSGDRVLVKVNMGCSGLRQPDARLTTHPAVVEAILEAVLDCGARASFGDDPARAGSHAEIISRTSGMADVAARTGAELVDFVAAGARETAGGLLYPATYLVSNAYFETDVVINAANCRSGPLIVGMSAAIKNMFGCVIGKRKQQIHNLFGADPRRFGRAIADIHRTIPADLSLLDMTTVLDGFGVSPAVRPVGLLLASTDPVALDTVAANVIGYEKLPLWTTRYASTFGLGNNDLARIELRGVGWDEIDKRQLRYPLIEAHTGEGPVRHFTRILNATAFRPRSVIDAALCIDCGKCAARCPMQCIRRTPGGVHAIDLNRCADCHCCLKVCENNAARLEFVGLAKALRRLTGAQTTASDSARAGVRSW